MQADEDIPIFPLNTVLFPGGVLPLRIFEARYLGMISECLRDQKSFGICAIRSGSEVGRAADCYSVGTRASRRDCLFPVLPPTMTTRPGWRGG